MARASVGTSIERQSWLVVRRRFLQQILHEFEGRSCLPLLLLELCCIVKRDHLLRPVGLHGLELLGQV